MNEETMRSLLRAADKSPPGITNDLAAVARRTVEHRRSRRGRRRLVGALAGCYLAGITTMQIWSVFAPSDEQTPVRTVVQQRRATPEPVVHPGNEVHPIDPSAVALSNEAQRQSAYEMLCAVGDERYRARDFETAVRYYRLALDSASSDELTITYDRDNWLLISLKRDRQRISDIPSKGASI